MAAPMANGLSLFARGSQGIWKYDGPPTVTFSNNFPRLASQKCRCMSLSQKGDLLAFCDGTGTYVLGTADNQVVMQVDRPKTAMMCLSPLGNFLAVWEPFTTALSQAEGKNAKNLHIYEVKTGRMVLEAHHPKQTTWVPQWTKDESIMGRMVNVEVHFFKDSKYNTSDARLQLAKIHQFLLPSEQAEGPYHVAAYIPGSKGAASLCRIFRYPHFGGAALATKSFYKADKVEMKWSPKGTAVLILTATESAADSYYGEQGLHYMDTKGESCLIPRAKNGPVYSVEWKPKTNMFVVVYGFMPAKATLFNEKCEAIFDFGTGPRNCVHFNPFGNIMCLTGFGNLSGTVEMWDLGRKRKVADCRAADSSYFEWAPDGQHWMTATCAPRLRVGNGLKVWHYTGTLLFETSVPGEQELWEARWLPAPEGSFPEPRVSNVPVPAAEGVAQPEGRALLTVDSGDGAHDTAEVKPKAYVPPALRGLPQDQISQGPKFREEYEKPTNLKGKDTDGMSKQALKNKKKRDAKKAKAAQTEATSATPPEPTPAEPAPQPVAASADVEKKIRNIKKKLRQVEALKEKKAAGETLEKNQEEKLASEASLLEELAALGL